MTNTGDGSVQLKIDSLERNQIKCKKMLSYLKFIFQDSNKLSKQETENERAENAEKIEMTPVNNNVLRLIINTIEQFSKVLDDSKIQRDDLKFKLKTKDCQVQEFLRVNSQSSEYIQQLSDQYRRACQKNKSLSQSLAVMHSQHQEAIMLLLQLTPINEEFGSEVNVADSNVMTTENSSIQQKISTSAQSVPASQLCLENSVPLVTQNGNGVQISQPIAESVSKVFTLPDIQKNRYKYNTNEIKEISGSEIEKSRFVDESKILKSSFVSGSNMTQLKRKSDLESLTSRSSKCFKPRVESYGTLENEASKSPQCYPEKFFYD